MKVLIFSMRKKTLFEFVESQSNNKNISFNERNDDNRNIRNNFVK